MINSSDILKASILIVDDQEANVSLLEQMLRGTGYVSIASTRDPHEVCELYRKNRYSLILLDLQMPGLDGFQVMQGLKAIETDGYLPVLVITAQPDHKLRALKSGAKDFISKPFDLAEILVRVHNMLEVRLLHLESELRTEQAENSAQALRASELSYRRLFETAKRAEEQLKASFKEVGDLNTEIRNFYHTLSHELKTPLTSAREFVSIVMDGLAGPLNETQLEYLGIAKESCDQLRLYINDLLDVTRLETGKMSIEFQELPLAALVERVVKTLAPAAAGKGVSLSCDCQPGLPAVPIDKQRILQVLTNLTANAIKFTPAGGSIRLSVSEAPADPECLQVAVCDTGRGIPQDQLDVIFDRLCQGNHNDPSAESRNGLGLGLYICRELVGLHGGRIWVESDIGKGSTFSFVVPKQAMTKGSHVLIVDDEYGMREALRHILEDQHFEVTTAEGGSEALELMGQKTPDVVVLDLMMAGLNGSSTLKEIRVNWGLIPVIVYTGYPDGDLMRQAMEFSPFTLLAKPCPPKRFVETVRRVCHTYETRFVKKSPKAGPAPAALATLLLRMQAPGTINS
ncbi:MAG TPA: response regulator, partial [Verrucomicrobiae bacterium]